MKKKVSRDAIAAFEREARASRRVGVGSRCVECGEDRSLALIPGSNPKICANCQREKNGMSPYDDHHPAGKANSPVTVPVLTNDHRADLSPKQYEWPAETWQNRSSSPLRAHAAFVRGYCETNEYFVATLLIPIAQMLESLDAFLIRRLGTKWWVGTGMERFAPKRKPNPVVTNAKVSGTLERFRDFAPLTEPFKAGRRKCRKREKT
ncbi:MAG TPA: hypothetical protein VKP61_06240 [Candidatus Acidoferrum sp.]|nr:hypothetical protein [Candidatus Acidoferrum sp.]